MTWLWIALAFAIGVVVGFGFVIVTLAKALAEYLPIIKALQEDLEALADMAEEMDDRL
jgi:uncharacterized membrane-anchored protein YhcB (DUF1043 family)